MLSLLCFVGSCSFGNLGECEKNFSEVQEEMTKISKALDQERENVKKKDEEIEKLKKEHEEEKKMLRLDYKAKLLLKISNENVMELLEEAGKDFFENAGDFLKGEEGGEELDEAFKDTKAFEEQLKKAAEAMESMKLEE